MSRPHKLQRPLLLILPFEMQSDVIKIEMTLELTKTSTKLPTENTLIICLTLKQMW